MKHEILGALTAIVIATIIIAVHGAEAKTYYIKSTVQLDSNCYNELYIRATDGLQDSDGRYRNLLGKITIEHKPTAGPANPEITNWQFGFDGSKIKVPTLRVYVITDDTVDRQYLSQKFDPATTHYSFHFHQHTDQSPCSVQPSPEVQPPTKTTPTPKTTPTSQPSTTTTPIHHTPEIHNLKPTSQQHHQQLLLKQQSVEQHKKQLEQKLLLKQQELVLKQHELDLRLKQQQEVLKQHELPLQDRQLLKQHYLVPK
jgi:hypothetical protein